MGFENGKTVEVRLKAIEHGTGRVQINTFHYDLVDSLVPADANDPQSLADTFRDDVRPDFAALYDNEWDIEPVVVAQVKDPQNPLAPRSEWVSGATITGTRSSGGDKLPRAMCGVAKLSSAHIGRRFTGRLFLGGDLRESDQADSQWVAAITNLWQPFLDAIPRQPDISPPASPSTANWSVYSRTQRAANQDPYLSHVTGVQLRVETHWLRSRFA